MNKWTIRFFLPLVFTLLSPDTPAQHAVGGKADLSSRQLESDGPLELSGTWEFYYNQLLTPADFKTKSLTPSHIRVPGSWHRYGDYPSLGYATYRLQVTLPSDRRSLSLYFPVINTSARIWINGELEQETGTVSADPQQYKPRLAGTLVSLPEDTSHVEVVLQAANFDYFSGGIASVPQIDHTRAIVQRMNVSNGIENFFAGSLMAMFIYQLILYFLYHRGKPFLWLALICLAVALRALIVHGGSFLLPALYPDVPWEIWKKLEFGGVYAIVCLFPLYVYHLFIEHAPKKPIFFFVTLSVFLCVSVLVTPQHVYGELLELCHLGLLLTFLYAIYSITRAWKAGNQDARIILFGVLASFPFILAEIMKNSRFFPVEIQFMYLVELGVLVFLLFQVYLLANHYAKSYKALEAMNLNLERLVEERSGELVTANAVKDRLLSVMSHDIKSPLNALRGILSIYNQGAVTQDEFAQFTQHIENDLSKTSLLVENILFWTAGQLKGEQVHREKFKLRQLVEENVQLFYTIAQNKKINIVHDTPENLEVETDRNILNLALRNLISNAIKFSFEGGEIRVMVTAGDGDVIIRVKDQGMGMDKDQLDR